MKWRLPRTPTIPTTKTLTGLGATGRMVNGVSLFDCRDAFSCSNANAADATPGGAFAGDGVWNRDAYYNESVTFDPAFAHQAGTCFTSTAPVGGGDNTVTPNDGARGSTVAVVIQLPLPLPAANVGVRSITFGSGAGIAVNSIVRYSQTLITANFVLAAGAATGARNVMITFNGGVTRTITNGFTVN